MLKTRLRPLLSCKFNGAEIEVSNISQLPIFIAKIQYKAIFNRVYRTPFEK